MYMTQDFPAGSMKKHTIMLLADFLFTFWVSSQQPARITKDFVSSSTTTPSIDLSDQKQQSSVASAEGVAPTQEFPSRSIV